MSTPHAISIGLPLWQALHQRPFIGTVIGRFERACNLADPTGRVVVLTLPSVGEGPFSIVLDSARFSDLALGETAYISTQTLGLGAWRLSLCDTQCWDAALLVLPRQPISGLICAVLDRYTRWPVLPSQATDIEAAIVQRLARGAAALRNALEVGGPLAAAAQQLAGLGWGLTPAGDDYLLGAMAALWLLGRHRAAQTLGQHAALLTNQLSRAFLQAGAQGHFTAPWHRVAQAIAHNDASACANACTHICQIGASSGRDALAGFSHVMRTMSPSVNSTTEQ